MAVTATEDDLPETFEERVPLEAGARSLRAVRHAAKPRAWIRAVMPTGRHPWEELTGVPEFAGVLALPDGGVQAGIYLADPDDDGRFILDVTDPEWLRAGIAAFSRALAQLDPPDTLIFPSIP